MSEVLFHNYVFLGLGLIGGSIAQAVRSLNPSAVIYAYDADANNTAQALADGTIDAVCDNVLSHIEASDVIFLAAPIGCNIDNLRQIASHVPSHCLITDVGSVKGNIHEEIKRLHLTTQFIGGHPMTGKETSGYASANERLLENAYYILTPECDTLVSFVEQMNSLVLGFHALPLISTPDAHDYATAAISHLPHLIAASLVDLVAKEDSKEQFMKTIAAGGFKDLTRIASSSPTMWEHICSSNADNISTLLDHYIEELSKIKRILDQGEFGQINELFTSSGAYRLQINDTQNGSIPRIYRLYVDILDEAGAIARIATLLADHQISIMNIGITHNREMAEGVLYIVFHDAKSMQSARPILTACGYTVMVR